TAQRFEWAASSSLGAIVHSRPVFSGLGSEPDRKAVPAVDRDHGKGEVHELLFAEVLAHRVVHGVRDMALADQSQGFGPFERRALALAVERGFAPGVEKVQALLGLAGGAGILAVHVEAV